jgi:hypothetical protein
MNGGYEGVWRMRRRDGPYQPAGVTCTPLSTRKREVSVTK